MTNARRIEAAARVRALHPPLPVLFAALRAELGAAPARAPALAAAPAPALAEPEPEPAPAAPATVPDRPRSVPWAEPPPVGPMDPLVAAFATVAVDAGRDADDLALRLVFAAEVTLLADAARGARVARGVGVPTEGDVGTLAIDAAIAVLQPYAATLVADPAAVPPPGLLYRLRAVARNAGVVEAVRGAEGWAARQRFGDPYCPRSGCYGRDGAELTEEIVAAEGVPPFDDTCNCHVEAVPR
ncbi:MAG TPA: hypothetical protein VFQ85_16550 [Mycobacteriales bacterium]|jgi:hypothetical protein|nr:hypothetical protein [Mycobacteriales bacterium]